MDCAKVGKLVSEYVEETLPVAIRRAVRAHLDRCPACAAEVAEVRSVWAQLSDLPAADPPPFFHENVMAAVARSENARRSMSWPALLPRLRRAALGALAVGGMAAALAWTLLLPSAPVGQQAGFPALRPRIAAPAGTAAPSPPRLRIARSSVVHPEYGPAYEFDVRIEGAERGTARLHLLPDDALGARTAPVARLTQDGGLATERLCVPFQAVRGDTMNLYIRWTADGEAHTTRAFVPIPRSDALPPERQSFGLPESSLSVAAREMAERYGRPITLEDVPDVGTVSVVAREQTAAEALEKALAGYPGGLRVSTTNAGIRVAPDRSPAAR